ncbi:MAG: tetratricopeptide repeat-containing sulfotransferase family protein [Sphingomonas sp.]
MRVAADPHDEAAADALRVAVGAAADAALRQPAKPHRTVAPEVAEAARLLQNEQSEQAEILLRGYLARVRNEPYAMLLMANIAAQCGFPDNAEKILRRSIELHPDRTENWIALARVLHDRASRDDRVELAGEAVECLDRVLAIDPANEEALGFKPALLTQLWRLDEAQRAFVRLVEAYPEGQAGWINYAHLLKTRGAFGEAVAAYRTALALDPDNGTAWWLFADLKLARFFPADIAAMQVAEPRQPDRLAEASLHFALAAAFHQDQDYAAAAEHLRRANALRLNERPHDIAAMRAGVGRAIETYTARFFADRSSMGHDSSDPIFVLGLPRSGSTLLEQILASHSAIEGTAELFAIQQIELELFQRQSADTVEAFVDRLDPEELEHLGQRYLDLTRFHRRSGRPHFIDKNPGNWRQIGFIHTILPNARIIDIRRNPMDCCFANYSQHFMVGVNYSYGFAEVASQYREYLRFMQHLDQVLPGRVHRVIYEDLVDDLEGEARRLLAYLGLPFEESCLRFFESDRPVRTPSSEQVRQPINRSGIGKWRRYEPWIGELIEAVGDMADEWRR